jgi:hypothetical protein
MCAEEKRARGGGAVETGNSEGLPITSPQEEKSKKRRHGEDTRLQRRIDELDEAAG